MITLDGESLGIKDVIKVARYGEIVEIDENALKKVKKSRKTIEEMLQKEKPIYGVNTGFGELAKVKIEKNEIKKLQYNLIRSHACGVGEALPEEVVRAMLLLRLNSLLKGYSGVRGEIAEKLCEALNKKFYPFVPSQGSVGASGDLVPLAHIALALIGEGEAFYQGKKLSSIDVLKKIGIEPLELEAKEGIALINGTQYMAAVATLSFHDSLNLLKNAMVAGAMSLQALKGTNKAFYEGVGRARPYEGQIKVAEILRRLTEGSKIIEKYGNERVQDAYTLRCMPQVFGAIFESLKFIEKILSIEINSATDNPLIFDNDVISCGNFHGEPVAIALDLLNIILTKMASFSERRIARLIDEKLSMLPPFLSYKPGINSGAMILQYVAASLTSENKSLAYPASVDSIPTSANQEDYQSMGSVGARKVLQILKNSEKVIAIEFITASQAIEFIKEEPSMAISKAYEIIRRNVERIEEDRPMHREIEKIANLIRNGGIIKEVEKIVSMGI